MLKIAICRYLVALIVWSLLAAGAWAGPAPVVHNNNKPRQGTRTIELEKVWQVGGAEEEIILGTIERVLVLGDGRVLLLDSQLSQVVECAADGKVLRTLGRAGDGPGELTGPKDLVVLDDGTLGLISTFPGSLVFLNADGTPGGKVKPTVDWAAGGFVTLHRALSAGDEVLLGGSVMTMDPSLAVQERTFFLGRFDREGHRTAEYLSGTATFDVGAGELHEAWQEFVWSRMAVTADGTVVVGVPRDEFELSWFGADGTLLRQATLPAEPWKRNTRASERMFGILDAQARHMPGTKPVVAPTEPVIVDLTVQDNGGVWCLTARSMWEAQEGCFAAYDVFSAEGVYEERVRVVCPGDATRDRLLFVGDRVFRVAGYWDAVFKVKSKTPDPEAEPMSVTCFRVK